MKTIYVRIVLVPVAFLSIAGTARAGEPSFEITQTVFSYTSASETETPKEGDATTTKTDSFSTMPSDLEIQMAYKNWVFSVYPTTPGENFGFAYAVVPHFELGLELGYNHTGVDSDSAPESSESISIAPNVLYGMVFGKGTLEFELHLGWNRTGSHKETTDEATGAKATTDTKASGIETEVDLTYAYKLTDNLSYAGGIGYTYGKTTDALTEGKTASGELSVKLLQLRYGIY